MKLCQSRNPGVAASGFFLWKNRLSLIAVGKHTLRNEKNTDRTQMGHNIYHCPALLDAA
jgi:hypothetical protein